MRGGVPPRPSAAIADADGARMTIAHINRIATAVPPVDVHAAFVDHARRVLETTRYRPLFRRMAERSHIEHRWSFLHPTPDDPDGFLDSERLYRTGAFPSTAARMQAYERLAPDLATLAAERLDLGPAARDITHVVVASCTGFSAPGIDLLLVERLGLCPNVERTMVGFMGCYAAINALKLARHIVRSEPESKVLVVCVELCTLHFQESAELEQVLSFLLFGDGCAAAIVSAEPHGLALDRFKALLSPQAADQITWNIRDQGFDMVLSGQVPQSVAAALRSGREEIFGNAAVEDIDLWAVHPGGRSILDAVESALGLGTEALAASREVLRCYGNMSSATILFVLEALMATARPKMRGCGMAFGPGLTAETLLFSVAA
jgi:predicted naringenin-chalcone synthase